MVERTPRTGEVRSSNLLWSTQAVIEDLIGSVVEWAKTAEGISGVALVGSRSRGAAGPHSDVDLLILAEDPDGYTSDTDWTDIFGGVEGITTEHWGAVTSLRVRYVGGPEAEFGIASPPWASVDPVDPGTERVVKDGFRILFDPTKRLERLVDRIR